MFSCLHSELGYLVRVVFLCGDFPFLFSTRAGGDLLFFIVNFDAPNESKQPENDLNQTQNTHASEESNCST